MTKTMLVHALVMQSLSDIMPEVVRSMTWGIHCVLPNDISQRFCHQLTEKETPPTSVKSAAHRPTMERRDGKKRDITALTVTVTLLSVLFPASNCITLNVMSR